jgi:hypothetical protein
MTPLRELLSAAPTPAWLLAVGSALAALIALG